MAFKRTIRLGGEEVTIPAQITPKTLLAAGAVILVLILLASSLYSVGPDEQAVVQQFGKYVRTTEPGLHMKLPLGIETATKVKVKYVFKEEFGFRTLRAGVRSVYSDRQFLDESLMLTGDLNLAVVEWIIQYRVKDARHFLFNVRDPRETLRTVTEAVVRSVVGDRSVSEVLTTGRMEIDSEIEQSLQAVLDEYESGIRVGTVKLQDVNPPDVVKPAFNDVNEAKQEKERIINQAWESYNKAVPLAEGEAKKQIESAEGYFLNRINRARGDAANYISVWDAYRLSKDVTRRRLYLETMNRILPKIGKKYILDENQQNVLPFLPLEKGGLR